MTRPSDVVTASLSSRSTRTAASCAVPTMLTHSCANRSVPRKLSTWSRTKPSTALASGTARIRPRSGSASSNSDSGSTSTTTCSVSRLASAACTAGSSIRGPARATKRSLSRKLRRAHRPTTDVTRTMHASATRTAAEVRLHQPWRVALVRSPSTSTRSWSRSDRRAATSAAASRAAPASGSVVIAHPHLVGPRPRSAACTPLDGTVRLAGSPTTCRASRSPPVSYRPAVIAAWSFSST